MELNRFSRRFLLIHTLSILAINALHVKQWPILHQLLLEIVPVVVLAIDH
jgi:hypothetical protein